MDFLDYTTNLSNATTGLLDIHKFGTDRLKLDIPMTLKKDKDGILILSRKYIILIHPIVFWQTHSNLEPRDIFGILVIQLDYLNYTTNLSNATTELQNILKFEMDPFKLDIPMTLKKIWTGYSI